MQPKKYEPQSLFQNVVEQKIHNDPIGYTCMHVVVWACGLNIAQSFILPNVIDPSPRSPSDTSPTTVFQATTNP